VELHNRGVYGSSQETVAAARAKDEHRMDVADKDVEAVAHSGGPLDDSESLSAPLLKDAALQPHSPEPLPDFRRITGGFRMEELHLWIESRTEQVRSREHEGYREKVGFREWGRRDYSKWGPRAVVLIY